jgi:hypothetical protein
MPVFPWRAPLSQYSSPWFYYPAPSAKEESPSGSEKLGHFPKVTQFDYVSLVHQSLCFYPQYGVNQNVCRDKEVSFSETSASPGLSLLQLTDNPTWTEAPT